MSRIRPAGAAVLALLLVSTMPSAAAEPTAPAGNVVSVGSSYSDQPAKVGFAALMDYCAGQTGVTPNVTTIEHAQFQDTIRAYLQGTPHDVFTWGAGDRMRSLAAQGLATPISDVWRRVGDDYSAALKAASTGYDGRQYLVPLYNYPWVVLYRKSLFLEKGYTVPRTLDAFVALAGKMQADGLVPLAFGDKDGWPAMGTFDILDMRMNGYGFHIGLMAGRQKWTDPKVKAVFQKWSDLLPFFQANAVTRSWQEGVRSLLDKQAGMYFIGTFALDQATDAAVRADLDLFPFPLFGNQYDGENAIDAPIDGLMLSTSPANPGGAAALLACAATGEAQLTFVGLNSGYVAAAKDADTTGYTPFQKKASEVIGSSNKIAQFLDRDSRPDFTGPGGMQAFLQAFLKNPGQNLDVYLRTIQSFWNSLPPQFHPTIVVRSSRPAGTITHGTAVTFSATVRPLGPTPATVRFAVYRRDGRVSRLVASRDIVADRLGRATLRYTLPKAGSFFVRARVVADHTFEASAWSPPIRYQVR